MGICRAFADLLSYPRAGVLALVDECLAELASPARQDVPARLASDLLAFRASAERLGLARLEEAYAAAFDFDPACSLSVGHHVFGETARRSVFMCRLAEMYRDAGQSAVSADLPDHLPAILRFLDAGPAGPATDELVADAVVPALQRVAEALGRANHPYAPVVCALLGSLTGAATETRRQGAPA